jgi:hypothetical protein
MLTLEMAMAQCMKKKFPVEVSDTLGYNNDGLKTKDYLVCFNMTTNRINMAD